MYQRQDGERITVYLLRQAPPSTNGHEPEVRSLQVAGLDAKGVRPADPRRLVPGPPPAAPRRR